MRLRLVTEARRSAGRHGELLADLGAVDVVVLDGDGEPATAGAKDPIEGRQAGLIAAPLPAGHDGLRRADPPRQVDLGEPGGEPGARG